MRLFRFLLLTSVLLLIACGSALVTMHFAIHGAEVKLPDLKGLTTAAASQKVELAGLHVRVQAKLYSTAMGEGRVLLQSPEPGAVVRRDWTVRVVESLGPQRVRIPDVRGQDGRAASIEVRRVGLELGDVARMPDALAQPESVLAQNPPADAGGVEQPAMGLLLAASDKRAAPAWVTPNWVGMPADAAQAALARAGVPPAAVQVVDGPAGIVVRQSVPPGERLTADTPLLLAVGR
jgi:eukaryotic-like serine/threonine-protein kinase